MFVEEVGMVVIMVFVSGVGLCLSSGLSINKISSNMIKINVKEAGGVASVCNQT